MGLDITVYERIARLEPQPEKVDDDFYEQAYEAGWLHVFTYAGHEHGLAGLAYVETVLGGSAPVADAGWFQTEGESFGFRAGSYGYYGIWRRELAEATGMPLVPGEFGERQPAVWDDPEPYVDRPFYELINFADNEGVLAGGACAALASDFASQASVLERHAGTLEDEQGAWFLEKVADWRRACELAAGSGAIVFH